MRLHLIRHGETDSNVAAALDTAFPGAPLNETGREQARDLAERMRAVPLRAVVTSDLTRAVETGAPMARSHGLTPVATPDLREIQAGDLEMTTDTASFHLFDQIVVRWFHGDLAPAIPGGESGAETMARLDRGVAAAHRIAGDDGEAAVVFHGAALRLWATLRATAEEPPPGLIRNTGVVVVDGTPALGWQLVQWEPSLV